MGEILLQKQIYHKLNFEKRLLQLTKNTTESITDRSRYDIFKCTSKGKTEFFVHFSKCEFQIFESRIVLL